MLTLVPGAMGGSETYARELLRELEEQAVDVRTLVSRAAAGFSPGHETVVTEYPHARTSRERTRALAVALSRRRQLGRHLVGAEVVHYPFTVPVPPPNRGQRSVVTLADVQHHDLPQLFSRAERVYRAMAYDRPARAADAVITHSEFCKQRIVRHLDVPPARVHVAPHGVRRQDFPISTGAREPFLIYPAKGWPHKNHALLLLAFSLIRRRRPDLRLVLTGVTAAELRTVPDGVEVRGMVSREELVRLLGAASALVFPSRYEGFGLPVLEAMSAGCPVAAARSGALPGVVGEAGVLFDPQDPVDIARGVHEALERSSELQALGLARASAADWSACAKVHLDVYGRFGG